MMYNNGQMPGDNKQNYQRTYAVEPRGKSYKCAALLTSTNPYNDLFQGKKNRIFLKKTKILGIEGNPAFYDAVREHLKSQHDNSIFIPKSLKNIDFGKYLKEGEQLDYFGMDACGNFTIDIAARLFKNQRYFENGMRFPLTVKVIDRSQKDETQKAIERALKVDIKKYIEKQYKNVELILPLGCTPVLLSHVYRQMCLLVHSMPSKRFVFNRVVLYRNDDVNNMATYMVFLDVEIYDTEIDVRRKNRFIRTIKAYNNLFKSKNIKLFKTARVGRPKKKNIKRVPYHISLGITCRKDMDKAVNQAKMDDLAKEVANDDNREFAEVRGSMVAGLNRHWTEVEKDM